MVRLKMLLVEALGSSHGYVYFSFSFHLCKSSFIWLRPHREAFFSLFFVIKNTIVRTLKNIWCHGQVILMAGLPHGHLCCHFSLA